MTHLEASAALEPILLSLLGGKYSSLTIGFNADHTANYRTAAQWADDFSCYSGTKEDRIDWPSDDERLKAIAANSVWTIQWYPQTPVGFTCVGASTLAGAIALAIEMGLE